MFTPSQLETLQALVNRIIPSDADPGGWEAGVGVYLMRQFERDLKAALSLYRLGLDALDAEAQAAHQQSFRDLPSSAQDDLLSRLERGEVQTLWSIDPAAFFRMAVDHCAEGYYSDPGNGGNLDSASWRMIGFEVTG